MDIDPLSLPIGANPKKDMVIGFDELGEPIRRTAFGAEYSVTPRAVTGGSRLKPMARAVADDPMGSIGGALKALGSGAWDAISMPGRAAAGETPTYGQALDTLGMISAGSIPFPKPAGALGANSFKAYHGSPHDFDRFSMDKIGTGEGAQAYGHGLYFAENEAVAKGYRDALSLDAGFSYKGKSGLTRDQIAEEITKDFGGGYLDNVTTPRGVADGVMDELIYGPASRKLGPERAAMREKLLADIQRTDPGKMYEVQINADPDTFLDWDKPLSEQPQAVMDALIGIYPDGMMGGDIARLMASDARDVAIMRGDDARTSLGASQESASRGLHELGIPGIKYKDAGSRGAGGSGTRNFVVFDDSLISILRKYGLVPGMFSAGLYASQPSSKEELQNYLGGL